MMHLSWAEFAQNTAAQRYVRLTPREKEVVEGIIHGLTNKEIATMLGLSAFTVDEYLRRLFVKFDVRSRAQLVAMVLCQAWMNDTT